MINIDIVKLVRCHAEEEGKEFISSGVRYKCTCFFHDENEPSLVVYPETNTWWCFGCSSGRTPEDFLMKFYGSQLGPGVIAGWSVRNGLVARLDTVLEKLHSSQKEEESAITIATRIGMVLRDSKCSGKEDIFVLLDKLVEEEDTIQLSQLDRKILKGMKV